jgi:hypothetical protein
LQKKEIMDNLKALSRIFGDEFKMIESISNDFDDFTSIFDRMEESFTKEFSKNVLEDSKTFEVRVPFNNEEDNFECQIEDGVAFIEISSKDGTRVSSVKTSIPDECDVDKVQRIIDTKRGLFRLLFKKKEQTVTSKLENACRKMFKGKKPRTKKKGYVLNKSGKLSEKE